MGLCEKICMDFTRNYGPYPDKINEISNKINEVIPLYKLVLNRVEFEKPENYRNSQNLYIKNFEEKVAEQIKALTLIQNSSLRSWVGDPIF